MLRNIFVAALMVQLSLALPVPSSTDTTTVGPPAHTSYYLKRYQLFDFILTKINNVTANEVLHMTSIYPAVLNDYNQWLADNKENSIGDENLKSYQVLKENLEKCIENVDNLKKDRQNCELQRKVQTTLFAVENIRTEINNNAINQIWRNHANDVEHTDEEKLKDDFVNNYFKLLTKAIEDFLEGLNDAGRDENKELIKWCNKFLSTVDPKEKLEVFEDIQDLYEEEFEREMRADDLNCKLLAQSEWAEKVVESLLLRLLLNLLQRKSV